MKKVYKNPEVKIVKFEFDGMMAAPPEVEPGISGPAIENEGDNVLGKMQSLYKQDGVNP